MRLRGKTALITGSTRGIGQAIARGYVREGAKVILHGRDEKAGATLAEELGQFFFAADLADPREVDAFAQKVKGIAPCLDVLVNNAAFEVIMPFEQLDMSSVDRMWNVNLRSVLQLTHALLPELRAGSGASVVNVTSIHQFIPAPQNGIYSMTKAALGMLTAALSVELAPLGIRVNNFAPGAVQTDMNRELLEKMGKEFAEWIPAGRVGTCEEMIGPAVFLASDESSYVTGSTLVADGAYTQNLLRYRPADLLNA